MTILVAPGSILYFLSFTEKKITQVIFPPRVKGHGPQTVPYFSFKAPYHTVAGTASSTLASRKNFAASSGGVGLI
jgi:hypothetical protein